MTAHHDTAPRPLVEADQLLEEPPLLRPEQVRRLLNVDPTTLTRWTRRGDLPSIQLPGGARRYRQEDVLRLLTPVEPDLPPTKRSLPSRALRGRRAG